MADKMKKAQFDFEDYLDSMEQMRKDGAVCPVSWECCLEWVISEVRCLILIPKRMRRRWLRWKQSSNSMTLEERRNPDLLNPSRKHRIAKGAGVDIADVNRMVKQFNESRKMMKKLPGMMGGKGEKGQIQASLLTYK